MTWLIVTECLSQMTTGIFRLLLRSIVTNDDGNISFVATEYLSQMTKGIFCLFVTEYLSQMTTGIFRSLLRSICHKWRREYFVCCYGVSVTNDDGNISLAVVTIPSFPLSLLIIGFSLTKVTRRVTLAEKELLTFPEHLSSTPTF
jgi:hypothetical protein